MLIPKLPCPQCEATGEIIDKAKAGPQLARLRRKAKCSQSVMAIHLKMNKATLCNKELGKRAFTAREIELFLARLKGS